jgi:hypothetical protein
MQEEVVMEVMRITLAGMVVLEDSVPTLQELVVMEVIVIRELEAMEDKVEELAYKMVVQVEMVALDTKVVKVVQEVIALGSLELQ